MVKIRKQHTLSVVTKTVLTLTKSLAGPTSSPWTTYGYTHIIKKIAMILFE